MKKEEKNQIQEELIKLILVHVQSNGGNEKTFDITIAAIKNLLNGHYEKYNFDIEAVANIYLKTLSSQDFQQILSRLNEKNSYRREFGVYYTPSDVTTYIVYNAFINYLDSNNEKTFNSADAKKLITQKKHAKRVINARVFDPTCGTSEFLINTLKIKIEFLKEQYNNTTDTVCLKVLSTIFGNDISEESIDISKIRLFFEIIKHLKNVKSYEKAVEILNSNFTANDYLIEPNINVVYEVIVGNPPYVEYGKSDNTNIRDYGNIYADVLENSIKQLCSTGAVGFVIPLSYVATARMRTIREYVYRNTAKQIILSYADRPDCLFDGVHQKLCIIFANKGNVAQHLTYTSNYKHWYKAEREQLLNGCKIRRNEYGYASFIPKVGNQIEQQIFNKVFTTETNNILAKSETKSNDSLPIFLNMRACFWMKAFTESPGSSEYKRFNFDSRIRDYILCILNSSLFWVYWTITSDCWHITNKELKHFYCITEDVDLGHFSKLAKRLEKKLEDTKEYIGTKQVDYAYKHSKCKDIIDEIDDYLAKMYNITEKQLEYIKCFALKYRSSNGV